MVIVIVCARRTRTGRFMTGGSIRGLRIWRGLSRNVAYSRDMFSFQRITFGWWDTFSRWVCHLKFTPIISLNVFVINTVTGEFLWESFAITRSYRDYLIQWDQGSNCQTTSGTESNGLIRKSKSYAYQEILKGKGGVKRSMSFKAHHIDRSPWKENYKHQAWWRFKGRKGLVVTPEIKEESRDEKRRGITTKQRQQQGSMFGMIGRNSKQHPNEFHFQMQRRIAA